MAGLAPNSCPLWDLSSAIHIAPASGHNMKREIDMLHHYGICTRRLLVHGAVGTALGLLTVVAVLGIDASGLGSMIGQAQNATFLLSAMLFKPMMLFGVCAIGLSLLWQLHTRAPRQRGRVRADRPSLA